ncbi:MAG: 3-deoxy-manno-octulosonate cytidylyltransferase [Gammaproteobacteria bacterium]
MSFKVYIPARYGASRLPGKPLLEFAGKPLVRHVWERAVASGAVEVVIATDDERIAAVARGFGAAVCLTAPSLPSGTDRIAAAAAARGEADDCVIVNVQGDEPHMPAAVIRQVADAVVAGGCDMATVCEPLGEDQLHDPNVVKVVRDAADRALYFSRATIPWDRDAFAAGAAPRLPDLYRRHVGIYGYHTAFLARFVAWPAVALEGVEALEQLRALVNGAVIRAPDALAPCGRGVDTPADLARLRGGITD